jgi:tRNA(adenine34) deaminase
VLWNRLALPWQICLEEAWTAYCAGSLPIGAAITDAAGRVLARGRNRIYESTPDGPTLYGHRLAHAEVNALVALDYTDLDPHTCVLYTTTEPCPLCTGAIRMIGLGAVHYASRDTAAGSIALLEATPFMRRRAIRVVGPQDAALEAIIVALHTELILDPPMARPAWLMEAWEAAVPRGVALGRRLYATGDLARLREADAPAAVVVDHLAAALGPA